MRFVSTISMLAVFLLVLAGGGLVLMRASLPQTSGEVSVTGLQEPVTIARDAHGIPHISAANDRDLMLALGYTHAQDRLWQMEINRRLGSGRMAEILGKAGLGFDRYFRTLGFRRRAEAAYAGLDAETQAALRAYADGVNQAARSYAELPPEFLIAGHGFEPWTPVDSLVWQKMMWLSLSGNLRHEIARAQQLAQLPPEQFAAFNPPYPGTSEPPWPDLDDLFDSLPLAALGRHFPAPEIALGSNNWVVDGSLTKSGKPLLANDPHLGMTTPAIWYLVRLHNRSEGSNVVGVTFPGLPGVVLGRNDRIAWGFTNTGPDIQDGFIEKLAGEGYLTPDGVAAFETRDEVIRVRFADPVTVTVRETRHGPVVSDVVPQAREALPEGYVLALRWTALDTEDTGATAFLKINKAGNFEEFLEGSQFFNGPQQNMIYADVDGNIGYTAPARVPVRDPENTISGRLPSPGWLSLYDWQGFLPADALPRRFNPASGMIVTANERVVDDTYPHFISRDWALPYRGNRIRAELRANAPHDIESFRKLQRDPLSDMARDIKPLLMALAPSGDPLIEEVRAWDGAMTRDSRPALVFQRWLMHLQERLFADELGAVFGANRQPRIPVIKSALYWSVFDEAPAEPAYYALPVGEREVSRAWCDDTTTPETEDCRGVVAAAFAETVSSLTADLGADRGNWRWGNAHILTQTHRPFSQIPVLSGLFALQAPQDGEPHTINVGGNSAVPEGRHASSFGASYRGIFDLSDLDASGFMHSTGQSGHPLSPHFGDFFPQWLEAEVITIPTAETVPADSEVLSLIPE